MKKILLIICLVIGVSCIKRSESLEIVHDLIAFDEMVMQTYNMKCTIENQLKEIAYIYQSLQYQIASIKKLNPDSYFAIRNFIINKNTAIKSLKNRIRNVGLKIGDEQYMLGDVLPTDKEIGAWFDSIEEAIKTKNSEQYKSTLNLINSKDQTIRQYLTETSQEAVALGVEADEFIANQMDYEDLLDEIEGNESVTTQLQIGNKLSIGLNLAIGQLVQSVASMQRLYGANSLAELFGDYKNSIPRDDFGVGGIITKPSDEFDRYMKDRDSHAFDPIELFNMDRD